MSNIFCHPKLTNELQIQLDLAGSQDSEIRAKANPVFTWAIKLKAGPLLFKALAECTNWKATRGLEKRPSHFTAPPPGGSDYCIGIVLALDDKGLPLAFASNAIPEPVKTEESSPANLAETLNALRSTAAQIKAIHQAVSCAASKEHMDWCGRIFREGKRYGCSSIFLIVLDGEDQLFYATTALVQGPTQIDRSLERTGRVK